MCYPSVALHVPDITSLIDDHCHCAAFQNEVQCWPQPHKLRCVLLPNCSDQHERYGNSSDATEQQICTDWTHSDECQWSNTRQW